MLIPGVTKNFYVTRRLTEQSAVNSRNVIEMTFSSCHITKLYLVSMCVAELLCLAFLPCYLVDTHVHVVDTCVHVHSGTNGT